MEDYEGTEDFDMDYDEQVDDGEYSGTETDYEDYDEGEVAVDDDDDPWAWAQDLDPSKVKKTWTQYTQTRQQLKDLERQTQQQLAEIEPFRKLREEILADPGLVQTIEEYLANARPVDREVAGMKQELQQMKTQMMTEMEIEKLNNWIRQNKYPKVDKEDILRYAVEKKIPNLQVAYKDMFFDELRERRAKEVTDGIKRSKGAASIPRTGKAPVKKKTGFTQSDWAKMSDEEFMENYNNYLNSM